MATPAAAAAIVGGVGIGLNDVRHHVEVQIIVEIETYYNYHGAFGCARHRVDSLMLRLCSHTVDGLNFLVTPKPEVMWDESICRYIRNALTSEAGDDDDNFFPRDLVLAAGLTSEASTRFYNRRLRRLIPANDEAAHTLWQQLCRPRGGFGGAWERRIAAAAGRRLPDIVRIGGIRLAPHTRRDAGWPTIRFEFRWDLGTIGRISGRCRYVIMADSGDEYPELDEAEDDDDDESSSSSGSQGVAGGGGSSGRDGPAVVEGTR
jgi:hypothetical protein